jgi:hypothetical protein
MTPERRRLEIEAALFAELMSELARRGRGTRESGAFLLTNPASQPADVGGTDGGWQAVTAVAYYDDLDPGCLTGNITFTADGYTALAALCRRDGLQIAADIHAHPGRWVRQSQTDAAHPMVALPGHLALIVPHYARWPVEISDLGAHHYRGGGKWTSRYGSDVASVLRLAGHRPAPITIQRLVRRVIGLLRQIRPKLTLWRSRG